MNARSSHRSYTTQLNSAAQLGAAPTRTGSLNSRSEATSPLYSYPIVWAAALAVVLMVMLGLVVQSGDAPQPIAGVGILVHVGSAHEPPVE